MFTSPPPLSGLRRVIFCVVAAIVLAVAGIGVGVVLPSSPSFWESHKAESPLSMGDLPTPFAPSATLIAPPAPVDALDLPFAIVEGDDASADRAEAHWLSGVGLSVFSQTLAEGAALLQRPHPHIPIRWSITAVGDTVFGERLSTVAPADGSNEGGAADSATWFVNVASGEVLSSSALLAPEREPTLSRLLSEALTHSLQQTSSSPSLQSRGGATPPHTQPPTQASSRRFLGPLPAFTAPFDDLSFAPDGALIVTLPRPSLHEVPNLTGTSGRGSSEYPFITIRIRPEVADTLLSPAGQSIRTSVSAAAMHHGNDTRSASAHPTGAPAISTYALPAVPLYSYSLAQGPEFVEDPQIIGSLPTEDVDCEQNRCVALTFDDGPDPVLTPRLLDILFREGVHATFFLQGDAAVHHPKLIVRALREGHTLGTHTWSHPRLPLLPAERAREEITQAKDVVIQATGRTPILMRPPFGEFSAGVLNILRSTGDAVIMWNVDTEDWKNKSVSETTRRALDASRSGSIILMHDVHPTSIQSVPGIIHGLRDRGFSLVSIPTLLGPVTPGAVYYGRP